MVLVPGQERCLFPLRHLQPLPRNLLPRGRDFLPETCEFLSVRGLPRRIGQAWRKDRRQVSILSCFEHLD